MATPMVAQVARGCGQGWPSGFWCGQGGKLCQRCQDGARRAPADTGEETFSVITRPHQGCLEASRSCGKMDCPADQVRRIGIISRALDVVRKALGPARQETL